MKRWNLKRLVTAAIEAGLIVHLDSLNGTVEIKRTPNSMSFIIHENGSSHRNDSGFDLHVCKKVSLKEIASAFNLEVK
jgi:hypothetical protein